MSVKIGPHLVLSVNSFSAGADENALNSIHPVAIITPIVSSINVNGMSGGAAGRLFWLLCGSSGGTNVINVVQESGSASAANRLAAGTMPLSQNTTGAPRLGMLHAYDAQSQRWRRIA